MLSCLSNRAVSPVIPKLWKFTPCVCTLRIKATVAEEVPAPIEMAYNSYESTGSDSNRAPFIVMHGLFGSKGNWNSLCKAYQKALNCKVYSVDARNHGDSPHTNEHSYPHLAEDIHAFLKQFNIPKASILGHSMGGRAVMYFALKYPSMVEKLVVVDIAPHKSSPALNAMPPLFEFMAKVDMPRGGTMGEARVMVDRQLSTRINDRALRSFLVTNLVQRSDGTHTWRINLNALLANYKSHIATFPDMTGHKFEGPTLFLGGDNSDHIPKNSLEPIKKLFPNAQLSFIPDAGHWVHSEQAPEFLKRTTEFLKS